MVRCSEDDFSRDHRSQQLILVEQLLSESLLPPFSFRKQWNHLKMSYLETQWIRKPGVTWELGGVHQLPNSSSSGTTTGAWGELSSQDEALVQLTLSGSTTWGGAKQGREEKGLCSH